MKTTYTTTILGFGNHAAIEIPDEQLAALGANKLNKVYHDLNYSTRKEYARQIADAKASETKQRRLDKIIAELLS